MDSYVRTHFLAALDWQLKEPRESIDVLVGLILPNELKKASEKAELIEDKLNWWEEGKRLFPLED